MLWSCKQSLDWGVKWSESCSVVSDSLRFHGQYGSWSSPCQITGVGSLFLLQGIYPTQESNPGLLHCRRILYQLSHKGSPSYSKEIHDFFFLHKKLMNADDTKQTNKNQITHHMFTIAYVFASHILIGTFNKWICMHLHKCIWVS